MIWYVKYAGEGAAKAIEAGTFEEAREKIAELRPETGIVSAARREWGRMQGMPVELDAQGRKAVAAFTFGTFALFMLLSLFA